MIEKRYNYIIRETRSCTIGPFSEFLAICHLIFLLMRRVGIGRDSWKRI
jgi:hypothetical protein